MKFNPKNFTEERVEIRIPGNPGIRKILAWNESKKEYALPIRGKPYVAQRTRYSSFGKEKKRKTFETIAEARAWRNGTVEQPVREHSCSSITFSELVQRYKKTRFVRLSPSTQEAYEMKLDKYYRRLYPMNLSEITSAVIDEWLDDLKSMPMKKSRIDFGHELTLLIGIFNFHSDYDDGFESPIKRRHRESVAVKPKRSERKVHLTEDEFLKFRECLRLGPLPDVFSCLATCQFYQSLRISEGAALHFEDVRWNEEEPSESMIYVDKSVYFPRRKGKLPIIRNSFKNAKANNGLKILPMTKETYDALSTFCVSSLKGLIFCQADGSLLTYRMIQYAYNKAFERAELPYRSTHILRHGGASKIFNESGGDLSLVQQSLGNTDYRSALTYAHRKPKALQEFNKQNWKRKESENRSSSPQSSTNDKNEADNNLDISQSADLTALSEN